MKKVLLVLLTLILLQIPSFAINKKMYPSTSGGENDLPNIFIYTIPDDNDTLKPQSDEDKDADESDREDENDGGDDEHNFHHQLFHVDFGSRAQDVFTACCDLCHTNSFLQT